MVRVVLSFMFGSILWKKLELFFVQSVQFQFLTKVIEEILFTQLTKLHSSTTAHFILFIFAVLLTSILR